MQKIISSHDSGRRLDKILRRWFMDISPQTTPTEIFKFLRKGLIRVNGKKIPPDTRVEEKDMIEISPSVQLGQPLSDEDKLVKAVNPKSFSLINVILEDNNILALNKPEGLASQSGTDVSIDLMSIIKAKFHDSDFPPQIAHRLDKDTSGIILLAKNGSALRSLQEVFRDRKILKEYIAIIKGVPEKLSGELRSHLSKQEGIQRKISSSDNPEDDSQLAISKYRVLESNGTISIIKVEILTGRMHQIRVQFSEAGHPLLGDSKYGDFRWNQEMYKQGFKKRLHLHSTHAKFSLLGKSYDIKCEPDWDVEM